MASLLFLISSFGILLAVCFRLKDIEVPHRIFLLLVSIAYIVFCFVAFGRIQGFISGTTLHQMIAQQGYDPSRLPISIDQMMNWAFIAGIGFNVLTSLWIILRGDAYSWSICMVAVFCSLGIVGGIMMHFNPIYSLFAECCAFMAIVGWVLGLSYIQFCVIGNIWIPAIAIISASICLIVHTLKYGTRIPTLEKIAVSGFSIMQIALSALILIHYIGTFNKAFYQCVDDLKFLAERLGTTYVNINILIYVVILFGLLVMDSLIFKSLKKRTRNNGEANGKEKEVVGV